MTPPAAPPGPPRPRLLIVSFSPIVSDARVLKQVQLFTPDYEVTTCGYGPAPAGVVAHLEIDAAAQAWHKEPKWLLSRQYRRVYWGNAAVRSARALLEGREFDVVLADDVDTVPLALSLEPACGVHVDLHEYAPRQNEDLARWKWFVAPYIRWLCRRFVTRAASVTTVGQGIADEYRRRFGFTPAVVTNAAPYMELEPGAVGRSIRLVHSGAGLRNRNLEIMIDAVAATTTDVTLDLFLTPNNPDYVDALRARAAAVPGVTVHDPVPYAGLVALLNSYDVGVFVLPPVNFNYAWALPNKLFDYVQARLGVIVGPSPEMARIVERSGVGAVSEDFTAESLARVLDGTTPAVVTGWKARSHEVARELSAEHEVLGWKRAVDALIRDPTTPSVTEA